MNVDIKTLEEIQKALKRGDKVELQPAKNGIIINRIRRDNIGFIELCDGNPVSKI